MNDASSDRFHFYSLTKLLDVSLHRFLCIRFSFLGFLQLLVHLEPQSKQSETSKDATTAKKRKTRLRNVFKIDRISTILTKWLKKIHQALESSSPVRPDRAILPHRWFLKPRVIFGVFMFCWVIFFLQKWLTQL